MEIIYVPNISDPRSILAAFQRAIRAVASPENLESFVMGRGRRETQHVHWSPERSALGSISMVPHPHDPSQVAFMAIVDYTHHIPEKIQQNPPLPPNFPARLSLHLETPDSHAAAPLVYDRGNYDYSARLIVTTDQLRNPHLLEMRIR